jgi:hypothetical protein
MVRFPPASRLTMRAVAVLVMIFLSGLVGCAGQWTRETVEGFRASADGAFLYGPVRGFVQTPAGGHPGTTSHDRPTLKELGIRTAPMADASIAAGWGAHEFYGGARLIQLSGSGVLGQTLVTHNVTFPAGTAIRSDLQFNWYRLGYAHRFLFRHRDGALLRIDPAIEGLLFDFGYRLSNGSSLSTSRAYFKGGVRLGVRSEWSPWPRFSILGDAMGSVPIPGQPVILSFQATGRYRLWGRPDRGGALSLGIGYDRIDHKDLQTVPNHLKIEMGPLVVAGLAVDF